MSPRQKRFKNLRSRASKTFWKRYTGAMECVYCKNPVCRYMIDGDPFKATIDHVIPLSDGGKSLYNNLVLSCYNCNQKRSEHNVSRF